MKSLCRLIKKVDLFGKPYVFEEHENNKFNTNIGVSLTFLIIISCIIMGWLFGKEIYERKTPTVISSDELVDIARISVKEFPIFFGFITGAGRNVAEAPNHIDMNIKYMNISEQLASNVEYFDGYKRCTADDYSDTYKEQVATLMHKMESYSFITLWCINQNYMSFQNDYASANSTLISVMFSYCNNSTRICGTQEERDRIMKDLYVVMVTIETVVNPNDINNPYTYYEVITPIQVGDAFLKRNFLSIERRKLKTNRGWILDDIVEEEYLVQSKLSRDVTTSYDGNLLWVTIDSPNVRNKIERSYMKVQDMLAKVGGFFNALFLCIMVLTKSYVDFSFYNQIFLHFSDEKKAVLKKKKTFRNFETIDYVVKKMKKHNLLDIDEIIDPNLMCSYVRASIRESITKNRNPLNFMNKKNNSSGNNNNNNELDDSNSNVRNNFFNKNNNDEKLSKSDLSKSSGNVSANDQSVLSTNKKQTNIKLNNINSIDVKDLLQRQSHYLRNFNNNIEKADNNNGSNNISNNNSNNNYNNRGNSLMHNKVLYKSKKNTYKSNQESKSEIAMMNNFIKEEDENSVSNNPDKLGYQRNNQINNNNNRDDGFKPSLKINKSDQINIQIEEQEIEKVSYLNYFIYDILCCKDKWTYQKKAVGKILSFTNITELSYEFFLKNEIMTSINNNSQKNSLKS